MSIRSFIQILILLLILSILGTVYYKYFAIDEKIVEEINSEEQLRELEKKISDLEFKNDQLNNKILENDKNLEIKLKKENQQENLKKEANENIKLITNQEKIKENKNEDKTESKEEMKKEIKNLVKDVEYTSIDQKGNKFHLLANSGKSNKNNTDILDLINVRGKITSDTRDTIYIVSDFAMYNSINLNSKFYENVIINYQDKEITCVNFDINMETNKAIAYNNVIVTDPKSSMKAGMVEFDLKTKNIDINPKSTSEKIKVIKD